MTLQDMFWRVLVELGDNTPAPLPGASECQPSSFTGVEGWLVRGGSGRGGGGGGEQWEIV